MALPSTHGIRKKPNTIPPGYEGSPQAVGEETCISLEAERAGK